MTSATGGPWPSANPFKPDLMKKLTPIRFIRSIGSALILALLSAPLAGCIHNKGLKVSKISGKDIRIVPVRSQPIVVMSENLGLVALGALGGGLVGGVAVNAANQGATADRRATLVGRLNAD